MLGERRTEALFGERPSGRAASRATGDTEMAAIRMDSAFLLGQRAFDDRMVSRRVGRTSFGRAATRPMTGPARVAVPTVAVRRSEPASPLARHESAR
jgi:hypothetical protein